MLKKIAAQLIMIILVVYVSLSFAEQTVMLKVDKTDINNVAVIELYQNADTAPFTVLDATAQKPWQISAELTSVNGVINVYAIPVDAEGRKGSKSPVMEDVLLDGSDITIIRINESGN